MPILEAFPRLKTLRNNIQRRLNLTVLPPPPPKTPYKGEIPPPPPPIQTQTKTKKNQASELSVEG